ncbi:alpha/beta fold hydrolase [Nesterenkonia sp. AY15]|uniref:alpha/beta fold hydrolase n=1 Tax=Nesterenkonia sp. AY15 TaxID=2901139 RepID=UPI00237B47B8|nr:alpha/beta hydrolase [Nesterenkonia sp. AY15]
MTADSHQWPLEHGPQDGETIIFLPGNSTGSWMWAPQVERLPGRHLLTPDLPGLGERYREPWPGLAGAADDVAGVIRAHALGGRAHVVGLSLGGLVVVRLLHRHPELVRSTVVTGAPVAGLTRIERLLIPPQIPLLRRRWYWNAQAMAFGVPPDSRELFVDSAVRVSAETNRLTYREVAAGCMPASRFHYSGPVLAIAGEKEQRSVRDGFPVLRQSLPQLQTWIAPKMHHPWNIEDPDLFSRVIREFADTGTWEPAERV